MRISYQQIASLALLFIVGTQSLKVTEPRCKAFSRITGNPFCSSINLRSCQQYHSSLGQTKLSLVDETKVGSLESDVTVDKPPRPLYWALWAGLFGYAKYFESTLPPESAEAANQLIQTAIFTPFDGSLSPYFVALWFSLGILPAVYGSLLLPGSKNQPVPALPFVISSFALGFFGVGPYLALRNKNSGIITSDQAGTGSGAFENKIASYGLLASTLYVIYYAITGDYSGGSGDKLQGFLDLFNSQVLARVSTLDFSILSLVVSEHDS
jgi:hypothetical protein